jgi:hypothetical protein
LINEPISSRVYPSGARSYLWKAPFIYNHIQKKYIYEQKYPFIFIK